MSNPVKVAVTGAAGQIGYSLLFRIASGSMLGPDQPVRLSLLEITPALDALAGVKMELDDCAFPLLEGIDTTDDPQVAFGDVDVALLVGCDAAQGDGARRSARRQRQDLQATGRGAGAAARPDVKVLVVGNPANTNALIACRQRAVARPAQFHAMTRLDHNRAVHQLAVKAGAHSSAVRQMTIWGNHSATQYPDIFHAEVNGQNAAEVVNDQAWLENDFIPTVQQRERRSSRPAA